MPEKVFVAMSGGVDSSVAALLLKSQGYDVTGITMQIWPAENEYNQTCCGLDAISDARRVCWELGIPHYVMNFRDEFAAQVVEYFCREYIKGRTPNPCIACNRFIKFDSFREKALAMGADYISTGHYARREYDRENDRYCLYQARDLNKDQSYALYGLTQGQLKNSLFPMGQFKKEEARELAREAGLAVAEKAESQEICFVTRGHYADFVEQFLGFSAASGPIIDSGGRIIGRHQGIHHYTVGQRKGLGVATGSPVYVLALDPDTNTVTIGDNPGLYRKRLLADEVNYIGGQAPSGDMKIKAKIRYSAPACPACLRPFGNKRAEIDFDSPQRAVTPGQAVVFYQDQMVLGGGTIKSVID